MKGTTVLSGIWAAILAAVLAVAALLASQSLIDNRTEKLVTGLASILLPLAFMVANALHHQAKARVHAAQIVAGNPAGNATAGKVPR